MDFRQLLKSYQPVRVKESEYPGFVPAAVLVPLFPSRDGLSILLTKRTELVETHRGQIAFPGGMADETDGNPRATALRETKEEVGIGADSIELLGELDQHPVPSRFIITPVVGFIEKLPAIVPHSVEVAEVIDPPLSFFSRDGSGWMEEREFRGVRRKVWFYSYNGHLIWGATAAIIRNLLSVLKLSK